MKYTVILLREADGGYVARVPALPGCVSQGESRDEALANIKEAAEAYVEDCVESGEDVPIEAEQAIIELSASA
ncbi:MAG: type II toxin-antitoxin system HicB family antitoxin [Fimbriimonadaceae bacterium]